MIEQLLREVEEPMRAREIHRAVERKLGEEITWSSIANCLRRNSSGAAAWFEKVGYGTYRIALSPL